MKIKSIIVLLLIPCFVLGDSLTMENDLFAHTDMAYTHGTRFIHDSEIDDHCLSFMYPERNRNLSYTIGQYMYTPRDISIRELIENDRPYGGWLYGGVILQAYTDFMMDIIEIDIGTTGPASLCEEIQKGIHRLSDSSTPMGWDNQIKEEIGIDLSWHRKFKYKPINNIEVIPNFGGVLGNIYTFASVGGLLRTGYNLPNDFGPLLMEPSNRAFIALSDFGFYVFAQVDSRYVVRNIFLDGNTFKESHSVPKEDFVHGFRYGASVSCYGFELIYAYTIRTEEHKFQDGNQEFGTIMFSWKY